MTDLKSSEAVITGMAPSGAGLADVGGLPVVVPGAVLGERVWFEWKAPAPGGRQGLASRMKVLEPSPFLEKTPCPHAGSCGGCPLGRLHEDAAARLKRRQLVVQELAAARLTSAPDEAAAEALVEPVRLQPENERRGFRNKAILYPVLHHGRARFGLYRALTHEVVPAEDCPQSPEWMAGAARRAAKLVDQGVLSIYDETHNSGSLRALLLREGRTAESAAGGRTERLAALIVRAPLDDAQKAAVLAAYADMAVDSLSVHVQPAAGNAVLSFAPGATTVLRGAPAIRTTIDGLDFLVRPETFLQVNTPQTEVLYSLVMEALDPKPGDQVLDLYCGIGTMTLMAAKRVAGNGGQAVGIEIVEASVACAEANARCNGIADAVFFAGPVEKVLGDVVRKLPALRSHELKVILDPAYKGLAAGVAEAVAALPVKRAVYVACSPKSLARDAKRFEAAGFALRRVVPVDLFPGAMHLEVVGVFERA